MRSKLLHKRILLTWLVHSRHRSTAAGSNPSCPARSRPWFTRVDVALPNEAPLYRYVPMEPNVQFTEIPPMYRVPR